MKNRFRKSTAVALCVALFATQSAFAYLPESALWLERRHALGQARGASEHPVQLAALPAGVAADPAALLRQFPSASRSTVGQAGSIAGIPSDVQSQFASLLGALPIVDGTVRKISCPPGAVRTVIHIQDIHLNAEAQRHIAHAVQSLIDHKKVDLVALEGASRPMDFSALRKFPYPGSAQATADYLFRERKISGPVYSALTSPSEIPSYVGIDDHDHYVANIEAYKRSAPLVAAAKRKLTDQRRRLDADKAAMFNRELARFDGQAQAFRDGKSSWGDYLRYLNRHRDEAQAAPSPSMEIFMEALNLESMLDFARVERERAQLINDLAGKLDKAGSADLLNHSVAYRLGHLRHTDFYAYVKTVCAASGVPLLRYPAMASYIRYIVLSDAIDVESVLREASAIEEASYRSLAQTAREKNLVASSQRLYLTSKLLDFALSSEEWNAYEAFGGNPELTSFESFYKEAQTRDAAMTANALAAMERARSSTTVLVTGGFHANGIDERLRRQGVAVIAFTPRVTTGDGATSADDTSDGSYLSVFAQEKTPLDKLFAGEKLFVPPPPMVDAGAALEVEAADAMAELGAKFGKNRVETDLWKELKKNATDIPAGATAEVNTLENTGIIKVDGHETMVTVKDHEIVAAKVNMLPRAALKHLVAAALAMFGLLVTAGFSQAGTGTAFASSPHGLLIFGLIGVVLIVVVLLRVAPEGSPSNEEEFVQVPIEKWIYEILSPIIAALRSQRPTTAESSTQQALGTQASAPQSQPPSILLEIFFQDVFPGHVELNVEQFIADLRREGITTVSALLNHTREAVYLRLRAHDLAPELLDNELLSIGFTYGTNPNVTLRSPLSSLSGELKGKILSAAQRLNINTVGELLNDLQRFQDAYGVGVSSYQRLLRALRLNGVLTLEQFERLGQRKKGDLPPASPKSFPMQPESPAAVEAAPAAPIAASPVETPVNKQMDELELPARVRRVVEEFGVRDLDGLAEVYGRRPAVRAVGEGTWNAIRDLLRAHNYRVMMFFAPIVLLGLAGVAGAADGAGLYQFAGWGIGGLMVLSCLGIGYGLYRLLNLSSANKVELGNLSEGEKVFARMYSAALLAQASYILRLTEYEAPDVQEIAAALWRFDRLTQIDATPDKNPLSEPERITALVKRLNGTSDGLSLIREHYEKRVIPHLLEQQKQLASVETKLSDSWPLMINVIVGALIGSGFLLLALSLSPDFLGSPGSFVPLFGMVTVFRFRLPNESATELWKNIPPAFGERRLGDLETYFTNSDDYKRFIAALKRSRLKPENTVSEFLAKLGDSVLTLENPLAATVGVACDNLLMKQFVLNSLWIPLLNGTQLPVVGPQKMPSSPFLLTSVDTLMYLIDQYPRLRETRFLYDLLRLNPSHVSDSMRGLTQLGKTLRSVLGHVDSLHIGDSDLELLTHDPIGRPRDGVDALQGEAPENILNTRMSILVGTPHWLAKYTKQGLLTVKDFVERKGGVSIYETDILRLAAALEPFGLKIGMGADELREWIGRRIRRLSGVVTFGVLSLLVFGLTASAVSAADVALSGAATPGVEVILFVVGLAVALYLTVFSAVSNSGKREVVLPHLAKLAPKDYDTLVRTIQLHKSMVAKIGRSSIVTADQFIEEERRLQEIETRLQEARTLKIALDAAQGQAKAQERARIAALLKTEAQSLASLLGACHFNGRAAMAEELGIATATVSLGHKSTGNDALQELREWAGKMLKAFPREFLTQPMNQYMATTETATTFIVTRLKLAPDTHTMAAFLQAIENATAAQTKGFGPKKNQAIREAIKEAYDLFRKINQTSSQAQDPGTLRPWVWFFVFIGLGATALLANGSAAGATSVLLASALAPLSFSPDKIRKFFADNASDNATGPVSRWARDIRQMKSLPRERMELATNVLYNIGVGDHETLSLDVAHGVGVRVPAASAEIQDGIGTGLALVIKDMLKQRLAYVASVFGAVFKTLPAALAAAFNTPTNVVAVVRIDTPESVRNARETILAANDYGDAHRSTENSDAPVAVVGIILAKGADASLMNGIREVLALAKAGTEARMIREEDLDGDYSYARAFRALSESVTLGLKASVLLKKLAEDDVAGADALVVAVGMNKAYAASPALLKILTILTLPKAGLILMLNMGRFLQAAIMA